MTVIRESHRDYVRPLSREDVMALVNSGGWVVKPKVVYCHLGLPLPEPLPEPVPWDTLGALFDGRRS